MMEKINLSLSLPLSWPLHRQMPGPWLLRSPTGREKESYIWIEDQLNALRKYYFERLPKGTRVSPVLWTAAFASLPLHWGFGKWAMKLEELLHLLLVQGVRQRTVPHLHLHSNFGIKIWRRRKNNLIKSKFLPTGQSLNETKNFLTGSRITGR